MTSDFGGPMLLAPLPAMLGIRPGMSVSVLNAPEGFRKKLEPLPSGVSLLDSARTGLDVTIFFAQRKVELVEKLPKLAQGMAVTGGIWVCFQHASENLQAPNEDFIRLAALEIGLHDNKKMLLDVEWTALRLVWKPRSPRAEKPQLQA
jgi:hypothetical protein